MFFFLLFLDNVLFFPKLCLAFKPSFSEGFLLHVSVDLCLSVFSFLVVHAVLFVLFNVFGTFLLLSSCAQQNYCFILRNVDFHNIFPWMPLLIYRPLSFCFYMCMLSLILMFYQPPVFSFSLLLKISFYYRQVVLSKMIVSFFKTLIFATFLFIHCSLTFQTFFWMSLFIYLCFYLFRLSFIPIFS